MTHIVYFFIDSCLRENDKDYLLLVGSYLLYT